MIDLKKEIHDRCLQLLDARITIGQNELSDLDNALRLETKSSMGDKYETSRELIQQEKDKASQQVGIAVSMKNELIKLDPFQKKNSPELGSLVITDKGNFYLSVGLGQILIEDQKQPFYAISPVSPIGQLLTAARVGEVITFNENSYEIQQVL